MTVLKKLLAKPHQTRSSKRKLCTHTELVAPR